MNSPASRLPVGLPREARSIRISIQPSPTERCKSVLNSPKSQNANSGDALAYSAQFSSNLPIVTDDQQEISSKSGQDGEYLENRTPKDDGDLQDNGMSDEESDRVGRTPTGAAVVAKDSIVPPPFLRLLPKTIPVSDIGVAEVLPPLPERKRPTGHAGLWVFFFFFLLPAAAGSFYYGWVATDQYVSEFRFNIVDTSNNSAPITSGLTSILGGSGLGNSAAANYTVVDYITSKQALLDVSSKLPLRSYFTVANVDFFSRLPDDASEETFLNYWQTMVKSDYDPVTGIATARVRAFDRNTAQLISQTVLASAETLVNKMQERKYADSVRFAQAEFDRASKKLEDLRQQMLALRNQSNVVDPNTSDVTQNIQLVTTLRLQLAQDEALLTTLNATAPDSPQIAPLKDRIKSYNLQISRLGGEISSRGTSKQLSKVVGEFEDLTAKQALALQEVTGDLTNLIQARSAADAQHIYLLSYVTPTLPSSSNYPDRRISILLVLLSSMGLYVFAKVMYIVVKSHAV